MSSWWTWGKHDAAEEEAPAANDPPVKKRRLRPGVNFTDPKHADGVYWNAVANGRIVADGGQGYASKQKAIQGLRAAAKVINAHLAKLDKKAKR